MVARTLFGRRLLRGGAIMLGAVALLIALAVAPASASPDPTAPTPSSEHLLAVMPMTLDCDGLTAAGRSYAKQHNICGYDDGQVHTDSVAYGNCGSSWIWVFDNTAGYADVLWGFSSTQGPVFYRNLLVSWKNWTTGGSGSYADKNWMASTTYSKDRQFGTKAGYVAVGLTGTVEVTLGTCSILHPVDNTVVTW